MLLWLGVFALSFAAEFASDSLSAFYQVAVRKLWRRKAIQWGLLLGALGWVDLGGIAAGWPLSALFLGSLCGGAAGTWFAVSRMTITARLKASDGGSVPFLEWFAEAENRAELEEIRRHLRCSPAEAAILLMLGQLTEAVDALGTEVQFLEIEDEDDEE